MDPLEERIPPAVSSAASNPKSLADMLNSMFSGLLSKQNKTPSSIPFHRERDPLNIEVYHPRKAAHKPVKPHGKLAALHRLGR